MSFDSKYTNKVVSPKGTSLNIRSTPSTAGKILVNKKSGSAAGRGTGQYLKMSDGNWIQIYLYTADVTTSTTGYVREDVIIFSTPSNPSQAIPAAKLETSISVPGTTYKSDSTATPDPELKEKAQQLLDDIAKNDNITFQNLVKAYGYLNQLKKNGVNVSVEETKYNGLRRIFSDRQLSLKSSPWLKAKAEWDSLKSHLGIGAVPVVGWVVIGILGVGVILFLSGHLTQAKQDATFSDGLEKTLAKKLTPAEQKQLKKEVKAKLDKEASAGMFSGLSTAAWGIAAFLIALKFLPSISSSSASSPAKAA